MASSNKVIITCAVTGAIHTPSMSPYLPVTADRDRRRGDRRGRGGRGDRPSSRARSEDRPAGPEPGSLRALPAAHQAGAPRPWSTSDHRRRALHDRQERVKPAEVFKPEVASLNMGSMNFGLFPMLDRFKNFKHDWEAQALENSRDLVFRNTFKDIEFVLRTLRRRRHALRVRMLRHSPSLQPRAISSIAASSSRRSSCRSVFGILGGIGPHPEDVMHMKRTADRLFGNQYQMVGSRRRPQSTRHRRSGRRDGRQRARRARGFACGSGPGKLATSQRRAGARRAPDHRGARALESRRPTRRARSCSSRAATRWRSDIRLAEGEAMLRIELLDRRPRRARRGPALGRRGATALLDRQSGREGSFLRRKRRRRARMERARTYRLACSASRRRSDRARCATASIRSTSRQARAASLPTRTPASRASA